MKNTQYTLSNGTVIITAGSKRYRHYMVISGYPALAVTIERDVVSRLVRSAIRYGITVSTIQTGSDSTSEMTKRR